MTIGHDQGLVQPFQGDDRRAGEGVETGEVERAVINPRPMLILDQQRQAVGTADDRPGGVERAASIRQQRTAIFAGRGIQAGTQCRGVRRMKAAEGKGEVVAFALFYTNFSTFLAQPGLYLEDLFVRPAFRGRGIGGAMLRERARLAVARGCGRFEWAVLDWNEHAIRFYRRMGADVLPDWRICRVTGDALSDLGDAGR